jgi:hypothetical protein
MQGQKLHCVYTVFYQFGILIFIRYSFRYNILHSIHGTVCLALVLQPYSNVMKSGRLYSKIAQGLQSTTAKTVINV